MTRRQLPHGLLFAEHYEGVVVSTQMCIGGSLKTFLLTSALVCSVLLFPCSTAAQEATGPRPRPLTDPPTAAVQQSNVPPAAQRAEDTVERAVERFRMGVFGGVGLDPELIEFGAQATFAPVFHRDVEFRPGVEFGLGELTTMFAINLDVLYTLPGTTSQTRWLPYVGAGPTFGLSHRGFEADDDDLDNVDTDGVGGVNDFDRFDFGDTDFNGGFNFIAGARSQGGMFFELRATAGGVSNVRLLAGFNF
jgi:hypothetical protein